MHQIFTIFLHFEIITTQTIH